MSKKNDNSKNRKQNDNKDKNKKILLYILISILSVVLIASIIYGIIKDNKDKDVVKENEITYTDLIKQIDEGNVEKVRMTVGSTTVKVNIKGEEKPKTSIIPSTQAFVELVQNKKLEGNNIELVQVKPNFLLALGDKIFTILPTALMAILFVILIKMQGLDGKGTNNLALSQGFTTKSVAPSLIPRTARSMSA